MASNERERSRLRRIPCSTCTTAQEVACDPIDGQPLRHPLQLSSDVEIANQRRRSRDHQQQVFEQSFQVRAAD